MNWFTAIFASFGRDIRDLFRNPLAFIGGVFGMVLSGALFFLIFGVLANNANAEEEDDVLEIDFNPGTLVKLGQEIEEPPIPEKIVIPEMRQEEEVVNETVTEDEKAEPKIEEKKEVDEKPKKPPEKPPVEKKDKKLPTSKLPPPPANTPFKDKPMNVKVKGDPFGDPGGWSDLKKDGDPWATAVMKALNGMKVGAFAAKGSSGNFMFQLKLCKDGSIDQVYKKGGSADAELQNAIRLSLEQLDLPKPPSHVAGQMKGNCAKINYTFNWSSSVVK
jgi:hypothetical protein